MIARHEFHKVVKAYGILTKWLKRTHPSVWEEAKEYLEDNQ